MHPSWTEGDGPRADLALLELERPVQGVKPVRLYEKDDEVGRTVVFVGNGHTGDGNTGPVRADGLWRAAHNQVQEADAASLRFVFDRPPAGLDLEGISGPGDSGGPALIRVDEELYLLGTSGSNSAPRGNGHCTYETIESYGRVSTNVAWIRSALAGKEPAHGSFEVRLISEGWPEASGVEAARAFLAAHNTGDPAELVAVIELHTPESQVAAVPREERLERFRTRIDEFGKLEAIATALSSDGMLIVLARGAKNERFFQLELSPREGKVRIGARDLPAQWRTELGSASR